jgi:phage regulator Rha-like protein
MQKSSSISMTVEEQILFIRGQKVMLDSDLAELYGVLTKNLNKAVKRNSERFPEDFMFQLTKDEVESLRFQNGTLKHLSPRSHFVTLDKGRGRHRKYRPYVFTEHGAVMLASVLKSKTAIAASIQVVRAFIRLRSILSAHKELAKKLESHIQNTDTNFKVVFDLVRKYLPNPKKPRKIGFRTK